VATRAHTVPRFYLQGFVAPELDGRRGPFVWVGRFKTGEIVRKSPKNLSISAGLYDGPGGLAHPDASLESHLQKIESAASGAINRFTAIPSEQGGTLPPEISRFLAWQAARTPGWMDLVQQWANEPPIGLESELVEPPPEELANIRDAARPLCLEHPITGERRHIVDAPEFAAYRSQGWKWVFQRDDHLEALHLQAWYFQVRHFPRLAWVKLTAPAGDSFITSDRGVAWLADGFADTPPAALRHPTTQVVAPLTKKVALVGRHGTSSLHVTPREVNRFVAFAASEWIAGASKEIVEQALADRRGGQQ
jgi:hypothetical protein